MGEVSCGFFYRGYRQSDGRPSEAGLRRDALAVWNYLVEGRGGAPQSLIFLGRSLGAALVVWLVARRPRLIVELTFTSMPDLAAELYWWLPACRLARFEYCTRDYLAAVRCPVLVAHSPEDEIIPYRHGETFAVNCSFSLAKRRQNTPNHYVFPA